MKTKDESKRIKGMMKIKNKPVKCKSARILSVPYLITSKKFSIKLSFKTCQR